MHPFPTCRRIRRLATALALGSLLQVSASQAAEYRFTPEPAYPPEVAKQIYQPLLDYLAKATGEKFVLLTSPNYSVYWRDILKPDQTDFSYDEAQFADYRIQHLQFVPVVRKAQPTTYTLLASSEFDGQTAARAAGIAHCHHASPQPGLRPADGSFLRPGAAAGYQFGDRILA
jgi:hypothetical protein